MSRFEPAGAVEADAVGAEERVARLVRALSDVAALTFDADGWIDSWNVGAQRLTGYSEHDVIGQHVAKLYRPEDARQGRPEMDMALAAARGRVDTEGWRVGRDGRALPVSVVLTSLRGGDGRLLGFGELWREAPAVATGPGQPVGANEPDDALFRLLVESSTDYAIFALDPTGRVVTWSAAARRMKGYRADEIIGRHFSTFYPDDDRLAGKPERELREATAYGRVEDEGWRIRKDGSRFWANVVITALREPDGGLRGFSKVTRDLTVRKRDEDALRDLLERERSAGRRLVEIDRLKNDFVAIVAHDLRAPLGVIAGFAELLRTGGDDLPADRRGDLVDRIKRLSTDLQALVEDVLDVARIEAGDLDYDVGRLALGRLVASVAETATLDSASRVVLTVADGLPDALGDERRVRQATTNLLSNALRYSPAGTPVDVEVLARPGEVVVEIRDQGPGIASEQLGRLFGRFERVDVPGTPHGAGLGLYIAKSVIEGQRGRIWADSTPGRGSTFGFALPVAEQAGPAGSDHAGPDPTGGSESSTRS